jgi:hypothetical protein
MNPTTRTFSGFKQSASDHQIKATHAKMNQSLEHAADSSSAALVAVHARHHSSILDIGTSSVVGDALANKKQCFLDLSLPKSEPMCFSSALPWARIPDGSQLDGGAQRSQQRGRQL